MTDQERNEWLNRRIAFIQEKIVEGDNMVYRWKNNQRGDLQRELAKYERQLKTKPTPSQSTLDSADNA